MKQFLASKGGTLIYAASKADNAVAATSPENLADGAIALLAKDGSTGKLILVDAAADLADVKSFFIARGTASGRTIVSDEVERKSFASNKLVGVAGAKKVLTISGIPANLPAGSLVGITVTDVTSDITFEWRPKHGNYMTKVANETPAVIAAALVASLNKKKQLPAVASVSGNDILLTANVEGANIAANVNEALEGVATVSTTSLSANPLGDYKSMRALEIECEGYQGRTNYVDRTTGPTADFSQLDSTATYTVYNFSTVGTTTRVAVPTDAVAHRFKRVYLAVPNGSTVMTTLESMLGAAALEEVPAQAEEVGV